MAKMYQTKALLEWKERVDNWVKIYGREQQDILNGFDPTKIIAVKLCAKCGKHKQRMSRHHIGSEMAFAKIRPDVYARRYVSFLSEDIVWLCKEHHERVHHIYKPLMRTLYEYAYQCQIRREIPNEHHLELIRQTIRKSFFKWIARKPYKKRKGKKHARSNGKQSSHHTNNRSRCKRRRNYNS